jgi:hypothetical protein
MIIFKSLLFLCFILIKFLSLLYHFPIFLWFLISAQNQFIISDSFCNCLLIFQYFHFWTFECEFYHLLLFILILISHFQVYPRNCFLVSIVSLFSCKLAWFLISIDCFYVFLYLSFIRFIWQINHQIRTVIVHLLYTLT